MNSVVAQKPASKPIDLIRTQLYLPSMQDQLRSALPPHVTVEKFLRVAMTALQQNPSLVNADRNSLFAAIVTSAQLGLLPDAQLGEAYFVPYKGKVQLIPGYRGLLKLARQGDVGFVEAEIIHENDETTFILGDNSLFESKVNWRDRGEMVAAYAVAKFRDGSIAARTVMMKDEIDGIRGRSQAANGPAWSDNYSEMAKKTVLRRLSKLLPLNTTAASAFRVSELAEELGRPANVIEGEVIAGDDDKPAASTAPETKPRRRRTALDDIGGPEPGNQPQGRTAPADAPDDALRVNPETGQIDFGDDDATAPPVQG